MAHSRISIRTVSKGAPQPKSPQQPQLPASPKLPQYLLGWRQVKHFLDDPADYTMTNAAMVKVLYSLGHQMKVSVERLQAELDAAGKGYVLELVKHPKLPDRWNFYANGEHVAVIDDDFGYDCFDVSKTRFLDRLRRALAESGVQPLTPAERRALDMTGGRG